MNASAEVKTGVIRWAIKQAIFIPIAALILFLPAGTMNWWQGWALVIMLALTAIFEATVFLPLKPDLLAERSKKGENTERWDSIITLFAILLLPIATWIVAGFDHRLGWSKPFSLATNIAGIAVWAASTALLIWAMWENAFFSGTARIQEERDHRVMTGGPYAIVRHPGYLGSILFYLVTPLVLNSWWAFIPTILAVILLIIRTALEDRMLREKLVGYPAYAQKTRFRLIPFIW